MPADLASILAGNDPTAGEQAQAYNQQLLAAAQLAHPSAGIFAGLNNALAMGGLNQVPGEVSNIAQQKVAAQPDLASAMAAPDPYQYMAANPGMNPIARAQLLSGATPGASASCARHWLTPRCCRPRAGSRSGNCSSGKTRPSGAAATSRRLAAAVLPAAALSMSVLAAAGRRLRPPHPARCCRPAVSGPAAMPATGAGLGSIPPPGPARMAWLARLTPQQRALLLGRLPAAPGAAPGTPAVGP